MAAQQVFLETELRGLLNSFSMENGSNTPDFILAQYLLSCLDSWNAATKNRDKWFGFKSFDNFPAHVKTIKL